jgi:hypothetical protein
MSLVDGMGRDVSRVAVVGLLELNDGIEEI